MQDLATCGAVCGATVTLLDQNGAPISGASALSNATTGVVEICLPGDYTYTPTVSATGYPLFYYGEIQTQLSEPLTGLGMLSNSSVAAFGSLFSGYSSTGDTLVIFTYTYGQCPDSSGWNVSLALPDGGAWPSSYTAYYSEAGTGYPSSALTATSSYGVAVLVDVDPTVSPVAQLVFTNPDAGACPSINREIGFTGRIRLGAGDFSVEPILVP